MVFSSFSIVSLAKLQDTVGLFGMLLKNCSKEHFALAKQSIRFSKEKFLSINPWLVAMLRELDPAVIYIAEHIEYFGKQIKHHINILLEKYMPSVVGDLSYSSKFAAELIAAIKNDFKKFTLEAKSCLGSLLTVEEILSLYNGYNSWLEDIHFHDNIVIFYQQLSR
jgi:hypothetical protein